MSARSRAGTEARRELPARGARRDRIRDGNPDEAARFASADTARDARRTTPRDSRSSPWIRAEREGCFKVLSRGGRLKAAVRLNLGGDPFITLRPVDGKLEPEAAIRLLRAAEGLAARFGIAAIGLDLLPADGRLIRRLGYVAAPSGRRAGGSRPARSLLRRQSRYARRIAGIHRDLEIPANYGSIHRIELQPEAVVLASIGLDVFRREQFLVPAAATAWRRMCAAAAVEGVIIQAVSAFRSVEYQVGLLQRKRCAGQRLEDILKVSAAPGFSEHHAGVAIDLATPGCRVLEAEFAASPAFLWLRDHAARFGFRLSFPRRNRHGLAFEPWHWRYGAG